RTCVLAGVKGGGTVLRRRRRAADLTGRARTGARAIGTTGRPGAADEASGATTGPLGRAAGIPRHRRAGWAADLAAGDVTGAWRTGLAAGAQVVALGQVRFDGRVAHPNRLPVVAEGDLRLALVLAVALGLGQVTASQRRDGAQQAAQHPAS